MEPGILGGEALVCIRGAARAASKQLAEAVKLKFPPAVIDMLRKEVEEAKKKVAREVRRAAIREVVVKFQGRGIFRSYQQHFR